MAQKKVKKATAGVEAPVVDVMDASNKKVGERMLAAAVFKVRVNDHLIYEAVKHYRAAGRRGTHKTKTRDEVSGSGRKPWRQKGTGRARVAEVRTPLWRHGGQPCSVRSLATTPTRCRRRRATPRCAPRCLSALRRERFASWRVSPRSRFPSSRRTS